jgi:hypothetical protein
LHHGEGICVAVKVKHHTILDGLIGFANRYGISDRCFGKHGRHASAFIPDFFFRRISHQTLAKPFITLLVQFCKLMKIPQSGEIYKLRDNT